MELSGGTEPSSQTPRTAATSRGTGGHSGQVKWGRSPREGRTCPRTERGRGAALEADPGRSPLGVTVPDRCDLVDPSEWPEVQAALTSPG